MKVILTAFNGLMKSDVMEWPELPPDMELDYPLRQIRHNYFTHQENDQDPSFPVCDIRATFRHNGRTFQQADGSPAREYELIRVSPKHWDDGGKKEKEREKLVVRLALERARQIAEKGEDPGNNFS